MRTNPKGPHYTDGATFAEPDLKNLMFLMRRAYLKKDEAAKKGKKARELVVSKFSPEVVVDIMMARIAEVLSRKAGAAGLGRRKRT